jgi:beta-RFAP synthase
MIFSSDHAAGVAVTVAARLHLGFLDLNGDLGRRFGSIGLAIDGLQTHLALRQAETTSVMGPDADRASGHLDALALRLGIHANHALTIGEAIPAHAGLGSGTQLALAVAAALRSLHRLPLGVREDAAFLSRGARSGVGIGLFETGGFVVDAGAGPSTSVPPVVSHMTFPTGWRIILVLEPRRRGLHGSDERQAFRTLQPMAPQDADRLCRRVLMQVLPALAERDLPQFGKAIREIQAVLGDYFAPQQGGRFTSREVGEVLRRLDRAGAHGIGQSSWGPTGFAFAPNEAEAAQLVSIARDCEQAQGLEIRIVRGLDRGADIRPIAAASATTNST